MFQSLSMAVSALNSNAKAVDVVSSNLANLNTAGYKSSSVLFQEMMSLSANPFGTGAHGGGAAAPLSFAQYVQGNIQSSGSPLDAAIKGNGFFVVKDANGQSLYTRNGSFQVSPKGLLQTATGELVQGNTGATGTGALGNIVVPLNALGDPKATTNFALDLNLDSRNAADATAAKPFTYSSKVSVYDATGAAHTVRLDFTTNGPAADGSTEWQVASALDDATATSIPGGTLKFDKTGKLVTNGATADTPMSIAVPGLTLANGSAIGPYTWNLTDANGSPRVTQYATNSGIAGVTQDGAAPSELSGISIEEGGWVMASYENGSQAKVARLALASIANPETMAAAGHNTLRPGSSTSDPVIGSPESGGRGTVVGGSLEGSTVDLSQQFTDLITYQRSYQANSKVITATDELMQDTVNLLR